MFLLLLMGLGAASVKAQVRIGGNTPPNPAAALDLNAAEGTTTGTKGLALPRVTLGSNTATLDGATANTIGMLVYNTGGSLNTGIYFWNGTTWNKVDDGVSGGDTIVGNEVVGATAGRGLSLSGSGTRTSPYTLGITPGGVNKAMTTITSSQLLSSAAPAGSYGTLTPPSGCAISNTWFNTVYSPGLTFDWDTTGGTILVHSITNGNVPAVYIWVICFK